MPRKPAHVALERALSKLGIASRTVARDWILEGRVKVDGKLRRDPLFEVIPEKARIEIDGEAQAAAKSLTLLLHKPRGTITTRSDENGRPTVFSLLPPGTPHLGAVGRLDWATSGLLILTNDTKFANWLTDPANDVRRVYLVSVRGEITEAKLARLRGGVTDQDERLAPSEVTLRKASGRESHLVVTLAEGKNREVRRLFSALGNEVTKLKRVAYGGLELGNLELGHWREVDKNEIRATFPGAPLREI